MKTKTYQIVRVVKGSKFSKTCLEVDILNNWDSNTLAGAESLCRVARESFGGEWVVMLETEKTVTVWFSDEAYNRYKTWANRKTKSTAKVK